MKRQKVTSILAGMLATLYLAGCGTQNPKPDSSVASTPSVNTSSSGTTSSSSQPSETIYYEVSFDSAGGNAVDTQRVESGKTAKAPATPTRDASAEFSYEFEGWYLGDALYDFATPVTGDIQLIAHWKETKNQYTVSFDSDGGTEVVPQSIAYGDVAVEPAAPTKESDAVYSYAFAGWYLGENRYDFATKITGNVQLVAHWNATKNQYTVSFDSDGGTEVPSQSVAYGEAAEEPEAPTRTGDAEYFYSFAGWFLGDALYDFTKPVTGNVQLTAHWNATKNQYTVTFHYKNASGDTTSTQTSEYGSSLTPPETAYTTAEGHTADTDGKWYSDQACTIEANVGDPIVGNLDLYAKYNTLLQHPFAINTKRKSPYSTATLIQMDGLALNVASSAFGSGATPLDLTKDDYQYEASAFTYNGEAFDPAGVILHNNGTLQFNFPTRANAQGDVIKVASGLGFTIANVHYTLAKEVEFVYNGSGWLVLTGHVNLTHHWGQQGVYMLKGAKGASDFALSYAKETNISSQSHFVFLKNGVVDTSASFFYLVNNRVSPATPLIKVDLSFQAGDYLTIQGGSYFSDGTSSYLIDQDLTLHYKGGETFVPVSLASASVQSVEAGDSTHIIANISLPGLEGKTLTNQTFPLGDGSVTSSSLAYADGKLTVTLPSAAADGAIFTFAEGTKLEADGASAAYFLGSDFTVRYRASTGWAEMTPFSLTDYRGGTLTYIQLNQTFDFEGYSSGTNLDVSHISFAVNGEDKNDAGINVQYFIDNGQGIISINLSTYTPAAGDVFTIKAGSIFTDGKKDYSLREDCNLRYNGSGWAMLTYVDSFQYLGGTSGYLQYKYNITPLSSWASGQSLDMGLIRLDVNGTTQAVASIAYYDSGIISINFGGAYTPKENDVFTIQAGSVFGYGNTCFQLKNAISMKYNGSSWVAA